MGPDFGKQDCTGQRYVIFAPLNEKVVEMILFQGDIQEAHKRARVYAQAGNYKIIERG